MIEYYGLSDVGLHRANNQDSYLTIFNSDGDFLAIVCDGIGGAKAGDVASKTVVDYFKDHFGNSSFNSLEEANNYILHELKMANREVYALSISNPNYSGMGTTLTGVLITKFGTLSLNAGDSRTYGMLDKKLFHLTKDHTLVNQMIDNGEITYDESLTHPKRHYLVKAVGVWNDIVFDVHRVKNMDYYLICSDGLCGYCSDDEIVYIMDSLEFDTCEKKANELNRLALSKGGYDNTTVIVVKVS